MNSMYYLNIQLVMAELGLYAGEPDGVWGPQSIEAKQLWENDTSFAPAAPNNGMPFRHGAVLPKGLRWDPQRMFILSGGMTVNSIKENSKSLLKASKVEEHAAKAKIVLSSDQSSDLGMQHFRSKQDSFAYSKAPTINKAPVAQATETLDTTPEKSK